MLKWFAQVLPEESDMMAYPIGFHMLHFIYFPLRFSVFISFDLSFAPLEFCKAFYHYLKLGIDDKLHCKLYFHEKTEALNRKQFLNVAFQYHKPVFKNQFSFSDWNLFFILQQQPFLLL